MKFETLRRWILEITKPIVVAVGKMHYPFTHKKIIASDYHHIHNLLRNGDVFLTRKRGEISNTLIPGFYTHAAIFVGGYYVVEAIGKGVVLTDILDFVMTKDYIAIVRPKFSSEDESVSAANEALNLVGKPYDYAFTPGTNAFYCAELCWYVYDKVASSSVFTLRKTLGVETVTAQDFYNAKTKWQIVFENR